MIWICLDTLLVGVFHVFDRHEGVRLGDLFTTFGEFDLSLFLQFVQLLIAIILGGLEAWNCEKSRGWRGDWSKKTFILVKKNLFLRGVHIGQIKPLF